MTAGDLPDDLPAFWSGSVAWSTGRKTDWGTPPWLVRELARQDALTFVLDAAAARGNAVAPFFIDEAADALTMPWQAALTVDPGLVVAPDTSPAIWLNPPYSRELGVWFRRAALQTWDMGIATYLLAFLRTDTAWWHDVVMRAAESVILIRGRLRFLDVNGVPDRDPAPVPSFIARFDPEGPPDDGPRFLTLDSRGKAEPHPWVCRKGHHGEACHPDDRGEVSRRHYPKCNLYPRRKDKRRVKVTP